MNFLGALAAFQTGTYTVTRRAPATVDADGRALAGAATTFTIRASVQFMRGEDLQRNSEGMRATERRKLYTTTRLQAIGAPDIIEVDGRQWEVEHVEDWGVLGGYFKAIIARLGN